MNLIPFAKMLEDATLGIRGQSIFVNSMPAACMRGVLLREKIKGTTIDYELPGYFRAKYQIIVRCVDYLTGEQLMEKVFACLTLSEQDVETVHYNYSRPITEPVSFPLSEGNLLEFTADFDTAYYILDQT